MSWADRANDWLGDMLNYTNGENWDATGMGKCNQTAVDAHRTFMRDCMRDEGLDPFSEDDCDAFLEGQRSEAQARGTDRDLAYGKEYLPFGDDL